MRKVLLFLPIVFLSAGWAADSVLDRWANAIGGRDKIAAIKAIYREGALEFRGREGTIKVWHTADGKYRKEEKVATFSSIEVFDGTNASVQQGGAPPRKMEGRELELAHSKAFANSNAIFFVFFPERHQGNRSQGDNSVSFKPEDGVEWKVTLDPQTSLPKRMEHAEGDRTIAVTFDSYEAVDGLKLEKEIHRSMGDPNMGSVIRFTKTVINPPTDPSLFSLP